MPARHLQSVPKFARFDPTWARSPRGVYFRLVHLDPEQEGLTGVGGIYVVWHAGIRPQWVTLAAAEDLAAALHGLADNAEVMSYEVNGGLFVSWAFVRPEFRDGTIAYLTDRLRPVVAAENPVPASVPPIVIPPPRNAGVPHRRDWFS